jgi:hypothetical protein
VGPPFFRRLPLVGFDQLVILGFSGLHEFIATLDVTTIVGILQHSNIEFTSRSDAQWLYILQHHRPYKAPRCTVFLRNDRVETTRDNFLSKNFNANKKNTKKYAHRSLSMV